MKPDGLNWEGTKAFQFDIVFRRIARLCFVNGRIRRPGRAKNDRSVFDRGILSVRRYHPFVRDTTLCHYHEKYDKGRVGRISSDRVVRMCRCRRTRERWKREKARSRYTVNTCVWKFFEI